MDIIPLDRFQEKLTEDLLDIKRVVRKKSWSDLLTHWVARHFLRLENSDGMRACGMQGSGEEGIDLFCVQAGTHGNLTVLALVGVIIRKKYSLVLPLKGSDLHSLKIHLLPRFETPEDYKEFFHTFDRAVEKLLKGLDKWVERATKRQKREIGTIDIRKIFISGATFQKILDDGAMRSVITKVQKQLPPLS